MPKDNTSFIARFNLDIEINHPLIHFSGIIYHSTNYLVYRH